jgi:proteasome lid subunit RPN8/RPN11
MLAIDSHYRASLPNECCGLLAGIGDRVAFVYPLTNSQASPIAFTIAPAEHFGALRHAEANGWDLIGAFHSHPAGPSHLSTTDLALAGEPDWVYLVVTDLGARAFVIRDRAATEIPIES